MPTEGGESLPLKDKDKLPMYPRQGGGGASRKGTLENGKHKLVTPHSQRGGAGAGQNWPPRKLAQHVMGLGQHSRFMSSERVVRAGGRDPPRPAQCGRKQPLCRH